MVDSREGVLAASLALRGAPYVGVDVEWRPNIARGATSYPASLLQVQIPDFSSCRITWHMEQRITAGTTLAWFLQSVFHTSTESTAALLDHHRPIVLVLCKHSQIFFQTVKDMAHTGGDGWGSVLVRPVEPQRAAGAGCRPGRALRQRRDHEAGHGALRRPAQARSCALPIHSLQYDTYNQFS